jgi:DNA-directed RNA polymerase subunit RPC12/RpoP
MKFTDKHLHEEEGGERILFWYECARCNKRRLFYDNNNEWRPRSHPCPKCRTEKKSQNSRKGDVITTIYSCPNCKHEETDILDLSTPKEKIDKNYEKDRLRFCLNDEQGREYLQGLINMEQLGKTIENIKEREENKELYEAVEAINKIPFGEVQKMLSDAFEKDGYTNLQFKAPEMQKGVVVEFTAVDSKTGRQDYDSRRDLKKIIETILAGTNWRLMSDGISYNLGFLSGRIKGVQSEEDLIKLIPKK